MLSNQARMKGKDSQNDGLDKSKYSSSERVATSKVGLGDQKSKVGLGGQKSRWVLGGYKLLQLYMHLQQLDVRPCGQDENSSGLCYLAAVF